MVSLNARKITLLSCLAYATSNVRAFVPASKVTTSPALHAMRPHQGGENGPIAKHPTSRREIFTKTAKTFGSIAVAGLGINPGVAAAVGKPPTPEELQRIKTGYEGIVYLLDNWEQVTTTCKENGGECKRDAEPVRRYLGLRSTTDPLFQIEKVFDKVKFMDIDPDALEPLFTAAEDWNAAVTMSNSMAFIAQFGEYNPGGGKDEVLKYLTESKKQVVLAKESLEKIIAALGI